MVALYLNINGNHKLIVNKLFPIYEDLGVDIELVHRYRGSYRNYYVK